jgi:hypothetical protein
MKYLYKIKYKDSPDNIEFISDDYLKRTEILNNVVITRQKYDDSDDTPLNVNMADDDAVNKLCDIFGIKRGN